MTEMITDDDESFIVSTVNVSLNSTAYSSPYRVDTAAKVVPFKPAKAPPFKIVTADKKMTFVAVYGPRNYSVQNAAPVYTPVERPGRPPILVRSNPQLLVISMTLTFAYVDRQRSVQPLLDALKSVSQSQQKLSISYPGMSGWWRITAVDWNVTDLNLKNEPTMAAVNVTFTRASDASLFAGPLTGGSKSSARTAAPRKAKSKKPRRYKVKAGDTMFSIAKKFYGNGNKWHKIADANKIKKPAKGNLKNGRILRIPR